MCYLIMKQFFLLFLFSVLSATNSYSCTSIIVSGKASADGRPFIFKNLDGTDMDVSLIICNGEKYRYVATTNKKNDRVHPNRVSSGYNETGFSIINTVAHLSRDKKDVANNTKILRRALEICKTLKDFETLLDTLPRPLYIDSNYGVMDAKGGVAYYEVAHNKYVKYDANNPEIAPNGYLIRTNFGFSGNKDLGAGHERYAAMEMYVESIKKDGKIRFEDIIRGATRFLTHGGTKVNLYTYQPENGGTPVFVDFKDFIPRRATVNAQLIQGIRNGGNALETTAWTICGFPLSTVCVPIWLTPEGQLPKIVSRKSNKHSMICDAGLELKPRLFPQNKERKRNEINIAQLINKSGTGILQRIKPIEDEVFSHARIVQSHFHKSKLWNRKVVDFYSWLDEFVISEYENKFGIKFDLL